VGALAIPGIGPLIAAGPIAAALAGAGAVGVAGGIVGALIGTGIPEYEAKRYEGRIREGGILLSVHCDDSDWVRRAKDILRQTGAQDISSTGEEKADFAASDKPRARRATGEGTLPETDPILRDRTPTRSDAPVKEEPLRDRPRPKSDWDIESSIRNRALKWRKNAGSEMISSPRNLSLRWLTSSTASTT
jgi:hypothetical protein